MKSSRIIRIFYWLKKTLEIEVCDKCTGTDHEDPYGFCKEEVVEETKDLCDYYCICFSQKDEKAKECSRME